MRLLACVSSNVDGQGTPLDEALSASWRVARVWPLVCVYPVMSLQVRLAVEALSTRLPVALKGTSRRLVFDELHEFHFSRGVGFLVVFAGAVLVQLTWKIGAGRVARIGSVVHVALTYKTSSFAPKTWFRRGGVGIW